MYLIIFIDSASRWMRQYGMRNKSETVTYTRKFVANMTNMGQPRCFRMDNGGGFTSRGYVEFATPRGFAANTRPRVSRNSTRLSKARSGEP